MEESVGIYVYYTMLTLTIADSIESSEEALLSFMTKKQRGTCKDPLEKRKKNGQVSYWRVLVKVNWVEQTKTVK